MMAVSGKSAVSPWKWNESMFSSVIPLLITSRIRCVPASGAIVKPVALTIRLFANMTAGHVLLAAILGFAPMAVAELGWVAGTGIGIVSLAAVVPAVIGMMIGARIRTRISAPAFRRTIDVSLLLLGAYMVIDLLR